MWMFVSVHVWACLVFDYNSIKTQADKTIKFALSKHRRTFAQHLKSEPYKDMPQNTLQHCRHRTLSGCIYICFYISYGKYNSRKIIQFQKGVAPNSLATFIFVSVYILQEIQFQKGVAMLQAPNSLAALIFVSVPYGKYNAIPKGCYHIEQYQYFLEAFNWSWTFCWWRTYTWVQCS